MASLSELQRGFAAAVLLGDRPALSRLGVVGGRLDADARIAIYRNNVLANYRKALAATFPVVRALVGPAFFGAAVDAFVRARPSTRGDVNRYGSELPQFLAGYPPARDLPYLPDVARLEWAVDQAGIAADAGPLDLASLAAVPPERLGSLRLRLHPSVQFVSSAFPLLRIWQANQPGHEDERVDLGEGGEALLVLRAEDGVAIHRLAPGADAFLRALGRDRALNDALELALAEDASFELGEALRAHVALRSIVAFSAPPASSTWERTA
ncbi:MAG TPA: DNA-binding domain-containing protein [Casimicrobiaceae bacterium]|nr:DNA-binding domain-containing protein [Casimicrobiaceae bacterium]